MGLAYGPQSSIRVGGRVLNTELPRSMTPTPPVRNSGHGLVNWVCHKALLFWDLCRILRVWRTTTFRSDGSSKTAIDHAGWKRFQPQEHMELQGAGVRTEKNGAAPQEPQEDLIRHTHTDYSQEFPEITRGTLRDVERPNEGNWEQSYEGPLLRL